jgi:hypothetical protein
MSQLIDLGKLRFNFAGNWSQATTYESNDVVKYGGNVYVYTYALKTAGYLPTNTMYWTLMISGVNFVGNYDPAAFYPIGDAIAYGSVVYVAIADNTGITPPNTTYWSTFAIGIEYMGTYSPTVVYKKNDIVTYGPSAYIAIQDTTAHDPTQGAYWSQMVSGISPSAVYNTATAYVPGNLVAYGANIYQCTANTTGNVPTNTSYWTIFLSGYVNKGAWSSSTAYHIGETVIYGGSTYQAIVDNTNLIPSTSTGTWTKTIYGFRNRAEWTTAINYITDDVVTHGGNSYICLLPHAATVFSADLTAGNWQKFNSGIRARGAWAASTSYLVNDIVTTGIGSAYIALADHTSSASFSNDLTAGDWFLLAAGGASVLPVVPANSQGKSLSVAADNATLYWSSTTASTNILYVAPNGSDSNNGLSLSQPFASLQKAVSMVPTNQKTAILVKSGTYLEAALPIVVPPNTAIIGDNTRTTIITPATGLAADGTTPNAQSTMFQLSDGSLLNKMTFQGMTGWVPGTTVTDISTSTAKGVFCALNPNSPIISKSPYVLECTSISSGGIGAYVNGNVHSSGNKSMLFHEYTLIEDNGCGIWVDNGGKAEAVSVFTYYCYFGYSTTNGGQIRSLSGNNSYGNYGTFSSGYDSNETAVTGTIYGSMLTLTGPYSGIINVGDTITSSSGATGVVTNAQSTTLYLTSITGTFAATNTITASSGGQGVVSSIGGQSGFILVLNNLTALPQVGGSIQITGDSSSYIIQSISGGWTGASSVVTVALAQQKATASVAGTATSIRYKFSLLRVTGHDFLNIGTGGIATTNYPGTPTQQPVPSQQVNQNLPGRIYYVSTDQSGNFAVGQYFAINQATGAATLNANSFNLSGLTSLRLGSIGAQLGAQINEFSTDGTLSQNSPVKVPTQSAVKTYVDTSISGGITTSLTSILGSPVFSSSLQANKVGYYLRTNGTSTYWDSMVSISGLASTFTYAPGYATTLSPTATSLVVASPTWAWSISGNPAAVTINSSTGVISIANTSIAGTSTIVVTASDGKFSASFVFSLVLDATYPVFLNSNTLPVSVLPSSSFSNNSAVTQTSGVTYSISAGALPSWITINASTGVLSGTATSSTIASTTYNFTVSAVKGGFTNTKSFSWTFTQAFPQGQAIFTTAGSYSWTAPNNVTSVSVVAVGAGGVSGYGWSSGGGGGGGGLGWKNNIAVTPGTAYTVCVGSSIPSGGCPCPSENYSAGTQAGSSWFNSCSTVMGGGAGTNSGECCATRGGLFVGDGGGCGGNSSYSWPSAGGGGAGGYAGNGGWACYASCCPGNGGGGSASMGNYSSTYGQGGGGGTGLYGQGTSGCGGFNSQQMCIWSSGCGYSSWMCGGYGGIGGSYCCGTGLNGHQGENGCCYCYNYAGYSYPGSSCLSGYNCFFNPANALHVRTGGYPGGGAGGVGSSAGCNTLGGAGGVRIIWGPGRSFPSTNTGDVTTIS